MKMFVSITIGFLFVPVVSLMIVPLVFLLSLMERLLLPKEGFVIGFALSIFAIIAVIAVASLREKQRRAEVENSIVTYNVPADIKSVHVGMTQGEGGAGSAGCAVPGNGGAGDKKTGSGDTLGEHPGFINFKWGKNDQG
jgi:hypothetical protein